VGKDFSLPARVQFGSWVSQPPIPWIQTICSVGKAPCVVKLSSLSSARLRMNGTKLLFLLHACMHGQVKFTSFFSYYSPPFLVIYLVLSPPKLSRHYYIAQRYKLIRPISGHSINIVAITKLYVSRPKNEFIPLTAQLYRSSSEMRVTNWEMSCVCIR